MEQLVTIFSYALIATVVVGLVAVTIPFKNNISFKFLYFLIFISAFICLIAFLFIAVELISAIIGNVITFG